MKFKKYTTIHTQNNEIKQKSRQRKGMSFHAPGAEGRPVRSSQWNSINSHPHVMFVSSDQHPFFRNFPADILRYTRLNSHPLTHKRNTRTLADSLSHACADWAAKSIITITDQILSPHLNAMITGASLLLRYPGRRHVPIWAFPGQLQSPWRLGEQSAGREVPCAHVRSEPLTFFDPPSSHGCWTWYSRWWR